MRTYIFCNAVLDVNDAVISCYAIPNASNYKFRFTNSNGVQKWVDSNTPSIQLIGDYFKVGGIYEVEVRVDDQAYGQLCRITVLGNNQEILIEQIKSNNSLSVYPNPFNTQIKLLNSKHIRKVELFDITGKLRFESNLQEKRADLNLDFLKNGIYILKVYTSENQVKNYKIIKE
ncbi:T9SS type A sorting domain-containing protein [Aquimarina sp. RZ0]|nr:T9SS type A sorting domain-containing protein [Aquimarina sp. RZ0]